MINLSSQFNNALRAMLSLSRSFFRRTYSTPSLDHGPCALHEGSPPEHTVRLLSSNHPPIFDLTRKLGSHGPQLPSQPPDFTSDGFASLQRGSSVSGDGSR